MDFIKENSKYIVPCALAGGLVIGLSIWAKGRITSEMINKYLTYIVEEEMGAGGSCGQFVHFSSQVWSCDRS